MTKMRRAMKNPSITFANIDANFKLLERLKDDENTKAQHEYDDTQKILHEARGLGISICSTSQTYF